MATDLIALVQEVRVPCGRPLDDRGLRRLHQRIAAMTASEVTEQRATPKRLRDYNDRTATPNRNRP